MLLDINFRRLWDDEIPPWAVDLQDLVLDRLDKLMIDTAKLMESARKQSADNAALRAALASTREQLAAALAANDTSAAQKDIDDAVALLDADNADTAAALEPSA